MKRISLAASLLATLLCTGPAFGAPKKDNGRNSDLTSPAAPTSIQDETQALKQIGVVKETIKLPDPIERYVDAEHFRARGTDLRDTATVTHRGATLGALQSFNFNFQNGNHQIKSVGIINNGPSITSTFRDEDGDDPYTVVAGYVSTAFMKESRMVTVSANRCNVRCTIRIPDMKDGETALLAGFSFDRIQHDANLRAISVEILPDREVANVVFFDDRGPDFSGFLPLPFIDVATGIDGAEGNSSFFNVQVQVLIVPEKIVNTVARIIGSNREDAERADSLVPEKYIDGLTRHFALMGFGLSFKGSDHFIEELGVNHWERPVVKFQDSDTDDSIAWFYDLAIFEQVVTWP